MKCAFCGKELEEQVGRETSCGQCPGGCRKVHCPACGYANPLVPDYLKRFVSTAEKKGKE